MFFSIIAFFKISFLIEGLNIHPIFGSNYLSFRCEGEVVINFSPPNKWANKTSQSIFGTIFTMHNQLSSRKLVRTFGHMAKFVYNKKVHSSTHQTSFFANHGLHPMFDIQGVHKVMNPTAKDRTV
jgi:hypothetical protein